MHLIRLLLSLSLLLSAPLLRAEVVSASDTHFVLQHQARSALGAEALWQRLIHPERWWNPAHSYSGSADALSLEARAGGLWLEQWPGGSVAHGRVLMVQEGSLLRLEAPFGPLQGLGAYTVWTIEVGAGGDGSVVSFREVAQAPPGSDMTRMSAAVDQVKREAIGRLAKP
ncbi:hypothetical protein [Parahaliea aestuarii]|uniref:SRPBCC family protein n=1 Tax=Parahaliea aestuarii TaxID=1852021 RepID=A0A5C9A1J2_9GAMM|nr:hypothetical protein [Parahaliea aestuarii]TXS94735.1 hypothetical protein FVW59_02140 [Parahaliea aestuarii]